MSNLICIFLFFLIFLTKTSFAFNFEECQRNFSNSYFWNPLLITQARSPIGFTTLLPLAPTSTTFMVGQTINSSSQFSSSTGNCKAYDFQKHEKVHFLSKNLEPLRIASASASGEVLDAFATLLKCNEEGKKLLISALKDNYQTVYFKNNSSAGPKEVLDEITKLFNSSQTLRLTCKNGF